MAPEPGLVLYDYWRSSACYRVRIALHLKGLVFAQRPVDLLREGGDQHGAAYRALNPQGLVPALVHAGRAFTQSLAICEYLDEAFPQSPLLPVDAAGRARVRALALAIACDIHPLNNLRVQGYLRDHFAASQEQVTRWMHHWMESGFSAIECWLEDDDAGRHCHGDRPGLADCCLVPQVYNAERFGLDLSGFPRIREISARCRELPAFAAAAPERQPDARPG